MQDDSMLNTTDIVNVNNNNIIFRKKFKIQNIVFYVKKIHKITTFFEPEDDEKSRIVTITYSFKSMNMEVPHFKVLKSIVKSVVGELKNVKKMLMNKNGFVAFNITAHNDDIVIKIAFSKKSGINIDLE